MRNITQRPPKSAMAPTKPASPFPSVDRVLHAPAATALVATYGHVAVVEQVRAVLADHRAKRGADDPPLGEAQVAAEAAERLAGRAAPALRRVFNLTGTVLHTNLGRALLPEAAIEQAAMAMREAANLEFNLESGGRGERDSLVEGVLTELCGAEAATVVNNNAAAVLLVLAAFAQGREAVLSRGEMIEIGGAFRMPDVMKAAGVRLVEVGTTNRTHPRDYAEAVGADTAVLMKVHTSNYKVTGFTAEVAEPAIAEIAHDHGLPFVVDLGAGSLIDLSAYGLPREPLVRETITAGADVVTFSGDKLLGGPQAGLIVGKKALIDRIKRHPLKRALRVSKMTLAALEATLLLYRTPDRLARELPTLRLLTRPLEELEALARRLAPAVAAALGASWRVAPVQVSSQVGSGSLPVEVIPSAALALAPANGKGGATLNALADRLRALPIPVIGRIADDRLLLDLRCLEDEAGFLAQLSRLSAS
jgi:L-seryl-tRNA(Ser) seleniumtransferase